VALQHGIGGHHSHVTILYLRKSRAFYYFKAKDSECVPQCDHFIPDSSNLFLQKILKEKSNTSPWK
jgi:hypothetical protein